MVENLAESKGLPYAAAFVTKTELQTKSNATNMDLSCWIFTWRGMFFNTFFLQIKSALIFFETFFQFFIKFLFHSLYRWFFFQKRNFKKQHKTRWFPRVVLVAAGSVELHEQDMTLNHHFLHFPTWESLFWTTKWI